MEAQQPQQETPGSEAHPEETENEAETPMPEPDPVDVYKRQHLIRCELMGEPLEMYKTMINPIIALKKRFV